MTPVLPQSAQLGLPFGFTDHCCCVRHLLGLNPLRWSFFPDLLTIAVVRGMVSRYGPATILRITCSDGKRFSDVLFRGLVDVFAFYTERAIANISPRVCYLYYLFYPHC